MDDSKSQLITLEEVKRKRDENLKPRITIGILDNKLQITFIGFDCPQVECLRNRHDSVARKYTNYCREGSENQIYYQTVCDSILVVRGYANNLNNSAASHCRK